MGFASFDPKTLTFSLTGCQSSGRGDRGDDSYGVSVLAGPGPVIYADYAIISSAGQWLRLSRFDFAGMSEMI